MATEITGTQGKNVQFKAPASAPVEYTDGTIYFVGGDSALNIEDPIEGTKLFLNNRDFSGVKRVAGVGDTKIRQSDNQEIPVFDESSRVGHPGTLYVDGSYKKVLEWDTKAGKISQNSSDNTPLTNQIVVLGTTYTDSYVNKKYYDIKTSNKSISSVAPSSSSTDSTVPTSKAVHSAISALDNRFITIPEPGETLPSEYLPSYIDDVIEIIRAYATGNLGSNNFGIYRPTTPSQSGVVLGDYDPADTDWESKKVTTAKEGAIYATPAIVGGTPNWNTITYYKQESGNWVEITDFPKSKIYYDSDNGKTYRSVSTDLIEIPSDVGQQAKEAILGGIGNNKTILENLEVLQGLITGATTTSPTPQVYLTASDIDDGESTWDDPSSSRIPSTSSVNARFSGIELNIQELTSHLTWG